MMALPTPDDTMGPFVLSRKHSSSSAYSESGLQRRDSTTSSSDRPSDASRKSISEAPKLSAFSRLTSWRRSNGNKVAENGDLDYLVNYGDTLTFTTDAIDLAAANGHLDVLQYLHVHRSEGCTFAAMDKAAANGHLEIVTWLHLNRLEGCTTEAMDLAATNDHFDIVKFLHKHRSEGCTTNAMDGAAANGHLAIVVWLFFNRHEGCTDVAMNLAASNGHVDVLTFLHENDIANVRNNMNELLDISVNHGQVNVVRWLIDTLATDVSYYRILDVAASENQLEIVQYLCQAKNGLVSLEVGRTKSIISPAMLAYLESIPVQQAYWNAAFPMDIVALHGYLDFLEYLHHRNFAGICSEEAMALAAGAGHLNVVIFLNENRTEGCSTHAIDFAAAHGHLEIIKYLLAERTEGGTQKALDEACLNGHLDVVSYLFDSDITWIEKVNNVYALNAAASTGQLEVVKYLCTRSYGEPFLAIDFAVEYGQIAVARYLHQEYGAYSKIPPTDADMMAYLQTTKHASLWSMNPLDFSAGENRHDLIEWFSSTRETLYTTKAMDLAASNGHFDMVQWLYENRTEGCTSDALDYAAGNGHIDILQFLHDAYQQLSWTSLALDLAAGNGHLTILKWLKENRDVEPTQQGFEWACRNGHLKVLEYLREMYPSLQGNTKALELAAKMGHVNVIEWLVINDNVPLTLNAMEQAMINGHTRVAKYILTQAPTLSWSAKTVDVALKKHQTDAAEWWVLDAQLPYTRQTKDLAAKRGSLRLLQYFIEKLSESDEVLIPHLCDSFEAATVHGHNELVKYIHTKFELYVVRKQYKKALKQHYTLVTEYLEATHIEFWKSAPIDFAVRRHEIWVRWLHNKGYTATTAAMDEAAARGDLALVQWFHTNRTEGCTTAAMDAAAALGRLDMVQWFHTHRFEGCTTDAMDLASQNGHFEVMQWLYDNRDEGCTAYAVNICAMTGRLDILKWLVDRIEVYTKNTQPAESFGYDTEDDFDPDLDPSEMEELKKKLRPGSGLTKGKSLSDALPLPSLAMPHHKLKSDSTDMLDMASEKGHLEMVEWLTKN
ncbi:hypothetical protein THRCLA_06572, partial [Thraustotheca clavata]